MKERRLPLFIIKILLCLAAAFAGVIYVSLVKGMSGFSGVSDLLQRVFNRPQKLIAAILLSGILFGFTMLPQKVWEFLFRFRYPIVLVLFIALVILGINGSSIGYWHHYFGTEDVGVLLGRSRAGRTDEWALFTPMTLSQYVNPNGAFSYFSPIFGGTDTDMFMLYGQPVRSVGTVFRPFFWGYLFLPAAQGLSWYWCGRFLALFLVSLEFGLMLTEKNRLYALMYALLLSLSPFVQWWFSINGLVEMLIAAELSILLFDRYLKEENFVKRTACVLGICLCAGAFILTIYPAWMIPLGYLILALFVWVILKNCGKIRRFSWKDLLAAGALVLATFGILASVFLKSSDFILRMLHSAYPGKRIGTGGWTFRVNVGQYIASIWYPVEGLITADELSVNTAAQVLSFTPLPQVLAVLILFRQKKKDSGLVILLILSLLLSLWSVKETPDWMNTVTLLRFTTGGRLIPILSVINLMILMRTLSLTEKPYGLAVGIAVGVLCAAAVSCWHYFSTQHYLIGSVFSIRPLFFLTAAAFAVMMSMLVLSSGREKLMVWLTTAVLALSLMAGGLVNPVRRGISDVTQIPALLMIRNINSDQEGLWAVEGDYQITNFPALAGARCLNATNIYPDVQKWKTLDPEDTYEEIYNRYAHISLRLKAEGQAEFELLNDDYFRVTMTSEELKTLGVQYVLAPADSSLLQDEGCEIAGEIEGYRVYLLQ